MTAFRNAPADCGGAGRRFRRSLMQKGPMTGTRATFGKDDPHNKRTGGMPPTAVQRGNAAWWAANPMAYDWRHDIGAEQYSATWFDAIDTRFIHGARLFAHETGPFDRVIPFDRIAGKRVLEIGCGMGLQTELMARAGADLTAIDITETAIAATAKRLTMKGLKANVLRVDAER